MRTHAHKLVPIPIYDLTKHQLFMEVNLNVVASFRHTLCSSVVSLFKKFITENENRDLLNVVNLYLDIEAYYTISSEKSGRTKRDTHANFINK